MRIGGPGWLGLVALVVVTTGCTAPAEAPAPVGPEAAVASYRAPEGAPRFCRTLATSIYVPGIPLDIGRLTADPGDRGAATQLEYAIADLKAVLDDVSGEGGYDSVAGEVGDLLAALNSATVDPRDDVLLRRISHRLAAVGTEVQPLCEFPT
jgi:hypothetical protein